MMEHHQTKAEARNKGEKDIVARPDLLIRRGLPICDCIVANVKEILPGVSFPRCCGGQAYTLYFRAAATIFEVRHMNVLHMAVDIAA
jgi:hypothetical protein